MNHCKSVMNHRVDERDVQSIVNLIRFRKPELEQKLCKEYSKRSGIDSRFIDLSTSVRGFMMMGLIKNRYLKLPMLLLL